MRTSFRRSDDQGSTGDVIPFKPAPPPEATNGLTAQPGTGPGADPDGSGTGSMTGAITGARSGADRFPLTALPESAGQVFSAIEHMSRRIDDLARELHCLGYFDDDGDDSPRAA